jgi:hypothetical protein
MHTTTAYRKGAGPLPVWTSESTPGVVTATDRYIFIDEDIQPDTL